MMHRKSIYNIIVFLITCSFREIESRTYNPPVVVVLMVKNEESVIIPTIEPFYKAGIKWFQIVDTGSEDKTVEITRNFFNSHPDCVGYIDQDQFVDFEYSRNKTMEFARKRFSDAGFFLIIDAEYQGHNLEQLLPFCQRELEKAASDAPTSYYVKLHAHDLVLDQIRLVRNESKDVWTGKVHEAIAAERPGFVPDVFFSFLPSQKGRQKSVARWQWDKAILLAEHKKNPQDSRTLFYLAQTYECLGDTANAIRYYLLRSQMDTKTEEDAVCFYRLGILYGEINCWHESVDYFLKAFSTRPTRAEALVRLAQHYWKQKNYALCYLYALHATMIPYPEHDILFIEKELYDWVCYDLLSCSAFYVGQFEKGYKAALVAKQNGPCNAASLENNVIFYQNLLNKTVS